MKDPFKSSRKIEKSILKGSIFGSKKGKRTLGIRDKQILYRRAKRKCENPHCNRTGRKIDFDEMHSGHKKASSKGGNATLSNSVCLCARCNKLQGTDTWETFLKKQAGTYGKRNKKITTKKKLLMLIKANV